MTATSATLSWNDSNYDGGSDVIDYTISFGVVTESEIEYTLLASGLTSSPYQATGLTAGTYYKFVIQSRNVVGLSDYSLPVTLQAA